VKYIIKFIIIILINYVTKIYNNTKVKY